MAVASLAVRSCLEYASIGLRLASDKIVTTFLSTYPKYTLHDFGMVTFHKPFSKFMSRVLDRVLHKHKKYRKTEFTVWDDRNDFVFDGLDRTR